MELFLAQHGADVTGVIAGFDRLRLRGSLRDLYQPSFLFRRSQLLGPGRLFPAHARPPRHPKAITATAHKLARIIYYLLTTGAAYDETVFARNESLYQQRREANLRKQAERNSRKLWMAG